ncbi:membrane protein [Actinorhabdospora filicis]|uniref:Membrane protein n=1 Tax=Actinorhabdospora filicis TaxID=1785913 RepID=A0A9W6SGS8_9ACTN|nr:DUF4191 domain-containing protein [Actinorhabdospora filicis]GLZ75718.1 membrane protein [Actinorhabdospora filicis]
MAEPEKVSFGQRIKQIGQAFTFTAKRDKAFIPLVIAAVLAPLIIVAFLVGFFDIGWWIIPVGVMASLLAAMIVLNLRVNTAVMNEAVGKPGAALALLDILRGWTTTPAVQVNTHQDMVHRAISRSGVVLLAEGSPGRLKSMIAQEKKRLSRIVGDAPVHAYIIGEEEGQLSVRKLRTTMTKLPKVITSKEVAGLIKRLEAISARSAPIPKGPIPGNMRPPKGMHKAMRGR